MFVCVFVMEVARSVYNCPEKKVHEQLQMRAREHLKQTLNDLKSGSVESELNPQTHHPSSHPPSHTPSGDRQTYQTSPRILSTVCCQCSISHTTFIRPPVRSNGRTYKMLVMFLFFSFARFPPPSLNRSP